MNWKPWLYSLILLAAPVFGQTAQVIQLTPDEAKQAAALYAEKAAVEAKIEALRTVIIKAHIDKIREESKGDFYTFSDGTWVGGFLYSTDFKYIVPAPLQTFQLGGAGCTNWPPTTGHFENPIYTLPLGFIN